jgi:DTW domain-containing protein YfiP
MISKRIARNIEGVINPRSMCFQCMRPSDLCVCKLIPQFTAHCNILLLQHPHEKKKYHSTSKLIVNAIKNAKILRGINFSEETLFSTQSKENFYLLYPGVDAVDASEVSLSSLDTLIAIDGTWVEARKIVYRNPFLRTLKKISFKEQLRSEYLIRKQPKDFCLSTLESIGHVLQRTAHSDDHKLHYDSLFHAFHTMVEKQYAFFPRNQK